MSMDLYAIHVAPRGGKVDLIADEITAARDAAQKVRWEYAHARGAIGLNQNDGFVEGLIFKEGTQLPEGWKRVCSCEAGFIAALKPTSQKKADKEAHKARKAELSALPALLGADAFTKRIGSDWKMAYTGGHGLTLLKCWFHRIGETTFVMTPWTTKKDEECDNIHAEEPNTKTRIAFHPEDCERVQLSRYYAAKEACCL